MKILAIESSCDETAVAIIGDKAGQPVVLSNVVSSQIAIHQKYGGVVPEVAAREHVLNIIPVINEALKLAGISLPTVKNEFPLLTKKKRGRFDIDAIAVTTGPGLITSLIVGVETAKALAYAWQLPLIPVNHIEGHIYSAFLKKQNNFQFSISNFQKNPKNQSQIEKIKFPAIVLTVSGGHNLLVLMKKHLNYKTIGETRDDAAGEAFDKGAKLLGLSYPGGPAIAAAASQIGNLGNASRQIKFPRPMIHDNNFDFSFSGLKTSLLYTLPKDKQWAKRIPEYAYEYQKAIVDVLVTKTIKAAKFHQAKTIILAGGVAANLSLRQILNEAITKNLPDTNFALPELRYTTDNAAMIGSAGYFKFKAGKTVPLSKVKADPNWEL